ncbi:MAG: hypothetical protein ABJO97_19730 [Roseibium sp.]|uniref:hypothetical protein n=1 Tax=Alphaproteobacteria TaxID=28211 RepID=UPI00329835D0
MNPQTDSAFIECALGVATSLLLAVQYDWAVYATFVAVFLLGAVPYAFIRQRETQAAGASSATTGDGIRSND